MKDDDSIKYLISGYYGIKTMDNYSSKLYYLKEVENLIHDYLKYNKIEGINYYELAEDIEKNNSLKTKLQDSLIVINQMKGPIELELLIKAKIKEIKYNEKK
jgi:hypothetical protein